ncbi:MAG: restriction endonuclease subunit S, partial [Epsilonproteobacteria bacterium]|nr:restriction endonuclease subunit S [Campylobacterota bacterium]
MSRLERYPSYKDSGVEWLGEIPEHWEVKRLGILGVFSASGIDKSNNKNESKVKIINFTDVYSNTKKVLNNNIQYMQVTTPEANRKKHLVKKGDLIFLPSSETYEDLGLSALVDEELDNTSFSYHVIRLEFKQDIEHNFRKYLTNNNIVVINDAVTKGLDKNVEFVDSGVEWIGKIPKHWEVRKGKRLFKQMKRPVREQDEIVTCFRDGEVTLRSNRRIDGFTNALKEHGYQGIRKGDFVIHNMDAFAGAIGISDSDGKSTPVYSVCRPYDENIVFSEYYARYLRNLALQDFILSLAKGIRERSTDFRFKDFGELELPIPPKNEQLQIVEYIENQTTKIDTAIELQQNYIDKLKEYKASLIDSVVTGKVR